MNIYKKDQPRLLCDSVNLFLSANFMRGRGVRLRNDAEAVTGQVLAAVGRETLGFRSQSHGVCKLKKLWKQWFPSSHFSSTLRLLYYWNGVG